MSTADLGEEYIHVDTGATVICTNRPDELNDGLPTNFECGTAANDGNTQVTHMGGFAFQATDFHRNSGMFR